MPKLTLRALGELLRVGLRRRVARHNGSVGVGEEGLGTEISSLFSRIGLETQIREFRGHAITPTTFD